MESVTFHNLTRGTLVVQHAHKARNFLELSLGLLPRNGLRPDEGLWLVPCRTIHTFGMRFTIDALCLDANLRVVALMDHLHPYRLGRFCLSTRSVLEVAAGVIASSGTKVGDQLGTKRSHSVAQMDLEGGL